MLEQLRNYFSTPDEDVVIAYQYKIPKSIVVEVNKDNGTYTARVEKINDEPLDNVTFLTEADSVQELIAEVNDMLFDYLNFPNDIKSRMPQLLPPLEFLEEELLLKSGEGKELVFAK